MSQRDNKRLLSVDPIGIGTPDVESPQSLLKRLAVKNHTSISALIDFQLKKLHLDLPRQPSGHLQVSSLQKVCGGNKYSEVILRCLADACRLPLSRIELMSMKRFEHIFHEGLSRGERYVNPIMMRDTPEADWYGKLIWNVQGNYFDTDGRALEGNCPYCRKPLKHFRWTAKIGVCSNRSCLRPIDDYLDSESCDFHTVGNWSEVEYAQWATRAISGLLSIGPEAVNFDFHKSFLHLYKHSGFDSLNAAERKLNINHVTIGDWLRGKGRVTIEKFLKLLFLYDLTPYDFFNQRQLNIPGGCCPALRSSPYRSFRREITRRSRLDRVSIRETIIDDIKHKKFINMAFSSYLEHRFKHPLGSLIHFTSDLRKLHDKERKSYQEGESKILAMQKIAEFEECYRICTERGLSFTRRNVQKIIPQPGILANRWATRLMKAMREGRHQVPPRPECFSEVFKH
jgi:hypothetical protein